MEYAHIITSNETKQRFLAHGPLKSDTQESTMIKVLDFYEKYHDYEEQIKLDLEMHGIFTGKFEGE